MGQETMLEDTLKYAMDDFFDVGDFAELLGVTTLDLIKAFPDEVEAGREDLEEMMGLKHISDAEIEE